MAKKIFSDSIMNSVRGALREVGALSKGEKMPSGYWQHLKNSGLNDKNVNAFVEDIKKRRAESSYSSNFDSYFAFGEGENNMGHRVFHGTSPTSVSSSSFGNLGGIKSFPERKIDIYAGANKNKMTRGEEIERLKAREKELETQKAIAGNSSFTEEQRQQATARVQEINKEAQGELNNLQSTKDIETGYKEGEKQWAISQEQDKVKQIQELDQAAANGNKEAAAEAQRLRSEAQAKLNAMNEPAPKVPTKAEGTTQSAQQSAVEAAEETKSAGGNRASQYNFEQAKSKLMEQKFMGREGQVDYFMKSQQAELDRIRGMKSLSEKKEAMRNWRARNESGPGVGDYLMGNKIPHKAAGFGIAAVAADVAMGDGRRSNAQLYSSPF